MSNDPNLHLQQQKNKQQPGGHGTLETYQLEKQKAELPGWQKVTMLVIGAAVIVGIILIFMT